MSKTERLIEQIKIVIDVLEANHSDMIYDGNDVLELIYRRYNTALDILTNNKDINQIVILWGCRAYHDSYSDGNDVVLSEMYKAETLYSDIRARHVVTSLLDGLLPKLSLVYDPPTPADWQRLELKFDCQFQAEFKYFIDLVMNYDFPGEILNVSTGHTNGNDPIELTYDTERRLHHWDKNMIPFYAIGNGDYVCIDSEHARYSRVYYYAHDSRRPTEKWVSFNKWLETLPRFLND